MKNTTSTKYTDIAKLIIHDIQELHAFTPDVADHELEKIIAHRIEGHEEQERKTVPFIRPQTERCGILYISMLADLLPDISIDDCDTIGYLRNKGVLQSLHKKLQLPENCVIRGVLQNRLGKSWAILIESPDFPIATTEPEWPEIHAIYTGQGALFRLIELRIQDVVIKL